MQKGDSFKDIFLLRERINKLFEDSHTVSGAGNITVWQPVVDIYETIEEFIVKAELPDVAESDINITVEGNVLKVNGARRLKREGRNYHQVERPYGGFSRAFKLPETVNGTEIRATLKDGILKVILPKRTAESPQHIEIK